MATLPLPIFPGFTSFGLVADAVKEIAVAFNAEGVNALQQIPEESVQWADIGTRVTKATFEAKIPVALTSLLGFNPFNGERSYHTAGTAAVTVKTSPWDLGVEWPIQFNQSGIAELVNFYGLNDFPSAIVQHARACKADMLASIIAAGFTNAALSVTAKALTLPQPGYASGLPLFTDGSASASHFSNPLAADSRTFNNLFLGAGKITDNDVFGTVLQNMQKVPHPTKLNMNLGIGVTDIIGPSHMRIPFQKLAIQQLSMQTTTVPGNIGVAASNIYNADSMARAAQYIVAAGMNPVRYHIAPQLDAHPYIVANPTAQMWIAVSANRQGAAWAEFAAPDTNFTPRVTLLGDGTEEARKTRKIRMFADLDAGVAAGLPHFCAMYFETTPT